MPELNPEMHYLGKLCKRGHKHIDTDVSLRYKSSHRCVQCAKDHGKKPESLLTQKKYREEHREELRGKYKETHKDSFYFSLI